MKSSESFQLFRAGLKKDIVDMITITYRLHKLV